ncbi:MAG: nucleotidyltransferase domain-containing protein [Cyanobacteriota bacterium]|nr:nucleotidyltransferase domain-containing protein [Cyanobacteriota bacterium]
MPASPPLPTLLTERLDSLRLLCLRYGVERLEALGYASSGEFDPVHSDLDFIVQMKGERDPGYALRFCQFAEDLEGLYQRPVDLWTERMIRNPSFKDEVQRTRRLLVEI